MLHYFQSAWDEVLGPIFRRPKHLQMAALCHRGVDDVKEYLLITSRDTGRWIIPKGWPIRGLTSRETALREAWEEAGVKKGQASQTPIGTYCYDKRKHSGVTVPVETLVYSVEVTEMAPDFPEADQRRQQWVTASEAVELVAEKELKDIFRAQ